MLKKLVWIVVASLISAQAFAEPEAPPAQKPQLTIPYFSKNETTLHFDTDAYPEMLNLVRSAQKDIRVVFYIFGGDTALQMIEIMKEKMARGVSVRVLLDRNMGKRPLVADPGKAAYAKLKQYGIPVEYATLDPIDRGSTFTGLDHQKFIVVDSGTPNQQAIVGSTNLSPSFIRYHDVIIKVKGPVVKDLAAQFDVDFYNAQNPGNPNRDRYVSIDATMDPATVPAENDVSQVRLLSTGIGRKTVLPAIVNALSNAKKSIYIQMHEMGVQPQIMAILRWKARQGVDVRVLLDPNDMSAAHVVDSTPAFERFKKNVSPKLVLNACFVKDVLEQNKRENGERRRRGLSLDPNGEKNIKVRLFKVKPLAGEGEYVLAHMKSVIVDGEKYIEGSTNWTYGGFAQVTETNLEVWGGKAPKQALAMFERDWEQYGLEPTEPGFWTPWGEGRTKSPLLYASYSICAVYRKNDPKLRSATLTSRGEIDEDKYWRDVR